MNKLSYIICIKKNELVYILKFINENFCFDFYGRLYFKSGYFLQHVNLDWFN